MFKKFVALGALAALVTACEAYPVAVVGDGGTVYRGVATASLTQGGWFQVTNGGNTCSGQYPLASVGQSVSFPVNCSNGLTGIGTATYQSAQAGGGNITMQDGSRWQFIFGRGARGV